MNNQYWKTETGADNGPASIDPTIQEDEDVAVRAAEVAQAAQAAAQTQLETAAEEAVDDATDDNTMAAVVAAAQQEAAEAQQAQDEQQEDGGEDGDGMTTVKVNARGRPLQTSKRAAQNRAAQRAFRHRKEQYIKELEGEVKETKEHLEGLKEEHQQLRDYCLKLCTKLLKDDDFPEPPAFIAADVYTNKNASDES